MPPEYNRYVSRANVTALLPEAVTREIMQTVPTSSLVMRYARRLPNMTSTQLRMPVLAGLITAGFVDGDTGLKPTSSMSWDSVYINVAELAVIVPIPESVLADTNYDMWGEIRPRIVEAFGRAFDAAVLYGTNRPTDWPVGIVPGAVAAGHTVVRGALGDLYEDILGEGGVLALVEEDGFAVNGMLGALGLRAKFRSLRTTEGLPILLRDPSGPASYEFDGMAIQFPTTGIIDPTIAELIVGDWNQVTFAIRQDITYKILDQAVIMDAAKNIVFNLPQQDMVALRVVMRLGWALPNPTNNVNTNPATRYPFAALLPTP